MITDGNFSAFLKELQMEWKEELNTSPEVKKAKLDLDYHRKKIRQMTEELNNAEHFEKELIVKEKKIEERIKPVLMRFYEGLEPPLSISRPLLQDTVQTQPWEKVVSLTKRRVEMLESTERQDLISLMWIILQLRDEYAEKLNKDAVEYLQDQAKRLLRQLGTSNISWDKMEEKEASIMLQIIQEVENIPPFVKRMLEFFLSTDRRQRLVYREAYVQTALSGE